jgi:uroporphyrinogen-III synthase
MKSTFAHCSLLNSDKMTSNIPNYQNAKVLTFASRRSSEMGRLIENNGGRPVLAPVLREVPLQDPPEMAAMLEALQSETPVWLILLTGVGTKVLFEHFENQLGRDGFFQVLEKVHVLARGPKPAHVLKKWGWDNFLTVPEPNTWHELLEVLDAATPPLKNSTAILQEFGAPHPALVEALEERGAKVLSVPVYRWAMPDDLQPVRAAISEVIEGKIDVTLWTSAAQVHHVFAIAETMKCQEQLRKALRRTLIGSIGPTTSGALREHGLAPSFEPEHPKMGHLIKAGAQAFSLLDA